MKAKDFVVLNIKNSQEMVSVGDVISVAKVEGEPGSKVTFDEVLLSSIDGKTEIGMPSLKGLKVEAEIVEHHRGEKIHTRTYKAKSRIRRHVGNRQDLTKIKILNIK